MNSDLHRPLDIAVLVGSLRRESLNKRLAKAIRLLAPSNVRFFDIPIGNLPLYNEDDDSSPSSTVVDFRDQIKAANGVLFVCPEYNRSYSSALKNAIEHGSRPYGQSVWQGKPCGVIGMTPGALGTALAQQHLRNVLAALDMPALTQPEAYLRFEDDFFLPDGHIHPRTRPFLQSWVDALVAWIHQHQLATQAEMQDA